MRREREIKSSNIKGKGGEGEVYGCGHSNALLALVRSLLQEAGQVGSNRGYFQRESPVQNIKTLNWLNNVQMV